MHTRGPDRRLKGITHGMVLCTYGCRVASRTVFLFACATDVVEANTNGCGAIGLAGAVHTAGCWRSMHMTACFLEWLHDRLMHHQLLLVACCCLRVWNRGDRLHV